VLVHAWYPGQEGGTALAEILTGKVNPSGKLPVSLEKKLKDNACFNSYYDPDGDLRVEYSEGIFIGYRHYDAKNIDPLFPFGFGLSYTTFEYSDLKLSSDKITADQNLEIKCTVKNTGKNAGAEAVQLYVRDSEASVPRPQKELKGFNKVYLEPGQSEEVSFFMDKEALSFFDEKKNAWRAEPGEFEALVGASSKDVRLRQKFELVR
jgi:beta-glucosidase